MKTTNVIFFLFHLFAYWQRSPRNFRFKPFFIAKCSVQNYLTLLTSIPYADCFLHKYGEYLRIERQHWLRGIHIHFYEQYAHDDAKTSVYFLYNILNCVKKKIVIINNGRCPETGSHRCELMSEIRIDGCFVLLLYIFIFIRWIF